MVLSILLKFLFPPPPSLFITAMSVLGAASLTQAGFMETKGKHMQYAKFFGAKKSGSPEPETKAKISGRTGMLLFYTPAFLAGLSSFFILPNEGLRFTMIRSALTVHFFKRIFEVLFVHKFSGWVEVESAVTISLSYFTCTATTIYAQHLTLGLPEPPIDLKYPGAVLFLIGISGNLYHHILLAKLRTKGEKGYKIPQGGLFGLVICPHYLFEILGFIGISCISQTTYSWSFTVGTIFYLMGRSYATREWYRSKFEDFPQNTKALIPYIF